MVGGEEIAGKVPDSETVVTFLLNDGRRVGDVCFQCFVETVCLCLMRFVNSYQQFVCFGRVEA